MGDREPGQGVGRAQGRQPGGPLRRVHARHGPPAAEFWRACPVSALSEFRRVALSVDEAITRLPLEDGELTGTELRTIRSVSRELLQIEGQMARLIERREAARQKRK